MIQFSATIKKYNEQGEKTGWTYIDVPAALALALKPGNKKAFRVKGKLDDYTYGAISLVPVGEGNFIMPLNATVRKGIGKRKGATVQVQMEMDAQELQPPPALMVCLADEPRALAHFTSLPKSQQHYFTRWINEAKTPATQAARISGAVNALAMGLDFSQTLRAIKVARAQLLK